MKDKIKTREVVKDIKVHDTAINVGDRIKNIGVKTKDTVNENINQSENVSPEQYATDKVTESMRTGSETVAVGTEKAVRKGASKAKEKVKEKVAKKKAKKNSESQMEQETPSDENTAENKPKQTKIEPKKNTDKTTQAKTDKGDAKVSKEKQDKPAVKEKTQALPKTKSQHEATVEEIKKPRQRKQTAPKTKGKAAIKKVGAEKQTVKTVHNEAHKIKQSKRSLDNTAKTIKKADNTAKAAKKTVKTTASTTKKTAEVAKRTKQTAQATARVTIKTVKVAAKVVVEAGKAVAAGVKSIGAIIAGGGVPAVVVIIIICLIGAIGGTCFGIFLANDETTGTNKTMSQAISELTSEHYANLTAMKASYTYDLLEVKGNTSINWKDVLAVYAVKTTSGENPLEAVTIDNTKIDLLRGIMEDMNIMTGVVTPKVVAETTVTTDENGNSIKTTTYVTKKVLTVSILQLSVDEISALYNFNDEQKALLEELIIIVLVSFSLALFTTLSLYMSVYSSRVSDVQGRMPLTFDYEFLTEQYIADMSYVDEDGQVVYLKNIPDDTSVYYLMDHNKIIPNDLIEEIRENSSVEFVNKYLEVNDLFLLNSPTENENEYLMAYFNDEILPDELYSNFNINSNVRGIQYFGYSEEELLDMESYVVEGTIDIEKIRSGEEVVLMAPMYEFEQYDGYSEQHFITRDEYVAKENQFKDCIYSVGDSISFIQFSSADKELKGYLNLEQVVNKLEYKTYTVKIGAIIYERIGWFDNLSQPPTAYTLIGLNESISNLNVLPTVSRIQIFLKNTTTFKEFDPIIQYYQNELIDYSFRNNAAEMQDFKEFKTIINTLCYSLIAIICLVVISILFIEDRITLYRNRKFYALLRLNGLNYSGLKRMLIFRAATVATIGILLSFVISSLIMYILFGGISEAFRYIDMVEVILPIIILFITIISSPLRKN